MVRSFACLSQPPVGLLVSPVFQEMEYFWTLIASRLAGPFFAEVIKCSGITGPNDMTHTWRVLETVVAMMPNVHPLFLLHRSLSEFRTAALSSALDVPQQWLNQEEFAFWRWMAGVDHRASMSGRLAAPSESAPCRRFLQSLKTVAIESQFIGAYQRPAPEEVLLSLFHCSLVHDPCFDSSCMAPGFREEACPQPPQLQEET